MIDSQDNLLEALEAPQKHDMQGLATFITIADDLGDKHFNHMLSRLDAGTCEPVWRERLSEPSDDAQALVERAAKVEGSVGDVARRLVET